MFESSPEQADEMQELKNKIGWVQIAVVSSNVLVNLSMVAKGTLEEIKEGIWGYYNGYFEKKKAQREADAREKILTQLSGSVVDYINLKEEEAEALEFCKEYHPERQWCFDNGLDFTALEEEQKFVGYLEKFKFKAKREIIHAEINVRKQIIQKYMNQVKAE